MAVEVTAAADVIALAEAIAAAKVLATAKVLDVAKLADTAKLIDVIRPPDVAIPAVSISIGTLGTWVGGAATLLSALVVWIYIHDWNIQDKRNTYYESSLQTMTETMADVKQNLAVLTRFVNDMNFIPTTVGNQ